MVDFWLLDNCKFILYSTTCIVWCGDKKINKIEIIDIFKKNNESGILYQLCENTGDIKILIGEKEKRYGYKIIEESSIIDDRKSWKNEMSRMQ